MPWSSAFYLLNILLKQDIRLTVQLLCILQEQKGPYSVLSTLVSLSTTRLVPARQFFRCQFLWMAARASFECQKGFYLYSKSQYNLESIADFDFRLGIQTKV